MSEQGIKQTEGKTSFSEIDWSFVEKMAKCMNLNKGKYPPKNWQKPMKVELLLDAAQRHLIELRKNEFFDRENGAEHAVAVALNMMMYSYQINNYSGLLNQCNIRNVVQYYHSGEVNTDKIEHLQKEIEDKHLELENLQKLFKNQQALYLKEKENNEALDKRNYFLSCTNQSLKKEIDDVIVFNGEQTDKVKKLTIENDKLKKRIGSY